MAKRKNAAYGSKKAHQRAKVLVVEKVNLEKDRTKLRWIFGLCIGGFVIVMAAKIALDVSGVLGDNGTVATDMLWLIGFVALAVGAAWANSRLIKIKNRLEEISVTLTVE